MTDVKDTGSVTEEEAEVERLATGNAENLFTALCIYLGMPNKKDETTVIVTAMAALEYAATVAKMSGIDRATFDVTVENAWKTSHGEVPSSIQVVQSLDDLPKV